MFKKSVSTVLTMMLFILATSVQPKVENSMGTQCEAIPMPEKVALRKVSEQTQVKHLSQLRIFYTAVACQDAEKNQLAWINEEQRVSSLLLHKLPSNAFSRIAR